MRRTAVAAIALLAISGKSALACDVGNGDMTAAHFRALVECVNALEKTLAHRTKNIKAMQDVIDAIDGAAVTVKGTLGYVRGSQSGTADLRNTTIVQCPPNTWISGIQGLKEDVLSLPSDLQPLNELQYTCRGTHGLP